MLIPQSPASTHDICTETSLIKGNSRIKKIDDRHKDLHGADLENRCLQNSSGGSSPRIQPSRPAAPEGMYRVRNFPACPINERIAGLKSQ